MRGDARATLGEQPGRPVRAEAPSQPAHVRLSPVERERAELAAQVNHQSFSEFCRDAIVSAAADSIDPDEFT